VGTEFEQVVILVHGTWARHLLQRMLNKAAGWCRSDSVCCGAVRAALGETETLIDVYNWSGRNSPTARTEAAIDLGNRIRMLRKKNPGATIHVIAHSHAGNVLCYALRDVELAQEVSSVTFLSTPFLYVDLRRVPKYIGERLEMIGSFSILIAAALVAIYCAPDTTREVYQFLRTAPMWLFLVALLPPALALGLLAKYVLVPGWRKLNYWSREFVRSLTLPAGLSCPTLIIRRRADEASLVLGTAHMMSQGLSWLLGHVVDCTPMPDEKLSKERRSRRAEALLRVSRGLEWLAGTMVVLGATTLVLLLIARYIGALPSSRYLLMGTVTVAAAVLAVGSVTLGLRTWIFLALLIPTVFLSIGIALWMIPFGVRFALTASALKIRAAVSLMDQSNVTFVQLPVTRNKPLFPWSLRHGTHSDPEALRVLEQWLRERR